MPRFLFSMSAIGKRRPLAPTAHHAGWAGCNILPPPRP
ncbi:MAG: DpnI domain-containing protein [Terriglobia bacterium]